MGVIDLVHGNCSGIVIDSDVDGLSKGFFDSRGCPSTSREIVNGYLTGEIEFGLWRNAKTSAAEAELLLYRSLVVLHNGLTLLFQDD